VAEFAFTLEAAPLLGGVDLTVGSIRIRERDDLAIVSVATPQGGDAALASAIQSGWGLDAPSPTQSTVSGDVRAVSTSPDQMLLIFPHAGSDAERLVMSKLSGAGYTTDQTDNWVVLELSGSGVLDALERLSPVDLSPLAFPENASARTVMEHMGALVIRTSADTFLLMSASSSASSFLHAVELSAKYVEP